MNIPDSLLKRLEEARTRANKPKFHPTEEMIAEQMSVMLESGYRDDVDPAAFRKLARYRVFKQHGETVRGLVLWGTNGLGKTKYLQTFSGARTLNATDITPIFQKHGQRDAMEIILRPKEYDVYPTGYFNLNIDDLGAEKSLNEYGVKVEPMATVLEKMHNRYMVDFGRYNITTNLSTDEISARYGQRIFSRMSEMFVFVQFAGTDQRIGEV